MRIRHSQFAISLAGGLLLLAGGLYAQEGARQPDLGRIHALYGDLQSNDDQLRDLATLAVLRDPDILAYPETKERLVQLLERLNELIERNFISRKGMPDGWGETIISPLITVIPKLYHDELPERAFLALARTSYNPDSPFAKWLGEHSRPYLAQVINLAKPGPGDPNNDELRRQNAVALLAHLLKAEGEQKPPLSALERSTTLSAIASACKDPSDSVRWECALSLSAVGDTWAIPLLEDLLRRETGPFYREQAQKALEKLRQRTARKQ